MRPPRGSLPAIVLDAVVVVAFVLIGRRTHDDPFDVAGFAGTAWPFVAGLAVGWFIVVAIGRPWRGLGGGVIIWVSTVGLGMVLRAVSDQGTAPAFVLVATGFLGALLIGWRAVALLARRGRRSAGTSAP